MYRITVNGKSVEVVLPCYVKYDNQIKSFMTCEEVDAEAVLVPIDEEQVYCDIESKTIRHEGFPIAKIEKI